MPGITGQGTTFNLPNFTGELFCLSPQDTPLLSSIGGLTGGKPATATFISWQTFDLRTPSDDRQRLEGDDAPQGEARKRGNVRNVLEIHQEALDLSYTKLATPQQIAGSGSNHPNAGSLPGSNPVTDEQTWQLQQQIKQVARDIEVTFITGQFNEPADNTEPRKTRGLIEAIVTNVTDAEGDPLSRQIILDAMQEAWDNGGLAEDETRTIMVGSAQKRAITDAFLGVDKGFRTESRTVGGVNVQVIETDFGKLNVMLNRYVPSDLAVILSLEDLAPRFLEIPGKGHFFVEPLAKTGASEKSQLYGEIGLEYGAEFKHALIEGLAVPAGS